jgi:4-carboxymuconolactone decarboxylase
MPTVPMVAEESDDPVVRSVFDGLKRRWGKVLNLYRILGWSPPLISGWAAFAWTLRFELEAPRRLRELLIVQIASLLKAQYEYEHHRRMAKAEGVSDAQIDALPLWRESTLFGDEEKVILLLGEDLAIRPGAKPQTMSLLESHFSHRQVVEFVVTASYYRGVAGLVNSLGLEAETDNLIPRNQSA